MTSRFKVADASCGHCKATIERAVASVDGVEAATLDLDTKELRVNHGETVEARVLADVIAGSGYTPEVIS